MILCAGWDLNKHKQIDIENTEYIDLQINAYRLTQNVKHSKKFKNIFGFFKPTIFSKERNAYTLEKKLPKTYTSFDQNAFRNAKLFYGTCAVSDNSFPVCNGDKETYLKPNSQNIVTDYWNQVPNYINKFC